MSKARKGHHRAERGSGAVRVSAAAAVVITGAVISFSTAVGGLESTGPGPVHTSAQPNSDATAFSRQRPTSAEASQVGETRYGPNADTTLLQVRKVLASVDRAAPAGREWYGIRARTCMHADARASGGVPWSDWVVVTESGKRYAGRRVAWDDFPPQQYSTSGIGRGKCNVGWVLVSVPRGTFRDVVAVTFRPSSPDALEWAV